MMSEYEITLDLEACRGYSAVRNCLLEDSLERVRFSRRQFDQMIGPTDGIGGVSGTYGFRRSEVSTYLASTITTHTD